LSLIRCLVIVLEAVTFSKGEGETALKVAGVCVMLAFVSQQDICAQFAIYCSLFGTYRVGTGGAHSNTVKTALNDQHGTLCMLRAAARASPVSVLMFHRNFRSLFLLYSFSISAPLSFLFGHLPPYGWPLSEPDSSPVFPYQHNALDCLHSLELLYSID
ncbi:hypothetical protein FRC11_006297, partial [Ceratobasidium sp. 423]